MRDERHRLGFRKEGFAPRDGSVSTAGRQVERELRGGRVSASPHVLSSRRNHRETRRLQSAPRGCFARAPCTQTRRATHRCPSYACSSASVGICRPTLVFLSAFLARLDGRLYAMLNSSEASDRETPKVPVIWAPMPPGQCLERCWREVKPCSAFLFNF